jgi:hypothetical protein
LWVTLTTTGATSCSSPRAGISNADGVLVCAGAGDAGAGVACDMAEPVSGVMWMDAVDATAHLAPATRSLCACARSALRLPGGRAVLLRAITAG